ncbi:unnamed protein product, partial [Mesorhabditis belari]|uniref:protein-tyrosine-phosphatase n=1 Tax=Mesorhabditis belari TaxID=2138241 RepID=A0AAF3ECU2_9BILA
MYLIISFFFSFFNSQPIHPIEDGHGKFDGEGAFPADDLRDEEKRINRPNHIEIPNSFLGTEATAEKALSYDTNIAIDEFCARVKEYHEKDDTVFHDEFEVLNRQSGWGGVERIQSISGDSEENAKRNRFLDVLPFEANRVKLSKKGQDYINASYVDSYNHPKFFIATQGPLGEAEVSVTSGRRVATVDDFWEMVWEKDCQTIIMLTQCIENCRPKCAQYWPSNVGETSKYRGIEVDLMSTTDDPICLHREFDVRMGSAIKEISQFHFKEWEDSKAPESREHLLDFVERIRKTRNKGPILVHCSAGVGRTGVFIALYNLLCQLADPAVTHVDVFKTVSKLREQRVRMVQTPEQYVTLYDTLEAAIQAQKIVGEEVRTRKRGSMHDSETQSENESVENLRV